MPELVRMYIRQVLIGFALSVAFTALLLGFDVGGLRHLIFGSSAGLMALVMLVVFNGIVFSGVQFGFAVMALAEPDDTTGGGKRDALPSGEPVRVPVAAGGGNRGNREGVSFPRA